MDLRLRNEALEALCGSEDDQEVRLFKLRCQMACQLVAGGLAGNRFVSAEAAMITVDSILEEALK